MQNAVKYEMIAEALQDNQSSWCGADINKQRPEYQDAETDGVFKHKSAGNLWPRHRRLSQPFS
jgi:hypothetical protein